MDIDMDMAWMRFTRPHHGLDFEAHARPAPQLAHAANSLSKPSLFRSTAFAAAFRSTGADSGRKQEEQHAEDS
eukprot:1409049-Prymnesium_polylepis.1